MQAWKISLVRRNVDRRAALDAKVSGDARVATRELTRNDRPPAPVEVLPDAGRWGFGLAFLGGPSFEDLGQAPGHSFSSASPLQRRTTRAFPVSSTGAGLSSSLVLLGSCGAGLSFCYSLLVFRGMPKAKSRSKGAGRYSTKALIMT